MKASENAFKLIKHYEGLKLEAYLCPAKVWTIAYGTTRYPNGQEVKQGDKCTTQEAEAFLLADIALIETKINRHFKNLNQNQFDALVSWVYNLGFGNLLTSRLKNSIQEDPNSSKVGSEWMRWVHAGTKVLDGLVKRRRAEFKLYSTGILQFDE